MDFRPHRYPIVQGSRVQQRSCTKIGVPDILHQLDDDSMADVYTPINDGMIPFQEQNRTNKSIQCFEINRRTKVLLHACMVLRGEADGLRWVAARDASSDWLEEGSNFLFSFLFEDAR